MKTPTTHLLPIYSICSESYREVYAVFRDSLEAIGYPSELIITQFYDDSDFDARGFQTPSWYFAIQEKLRFILDQVRANPGKLIISSDVDIQFFPPFLEADIALRMDERHLDMLFMRELTREEPPINAGFIVIRCTEVVGRLLESVLERIRKEQLPFADQTAFTEALREREHCVEFDTIPKELVIWGTATPPAIFDAWFHHAVCCSTNAEKLAQIHTIRVIRDAGSTWARKTGYRSRVLLRQLKARFRRFLGEPPRPCDCPGAVISSPENPPWTG